MTKKAPSKILYFDIDGTLLFGDSEAKPCLANGAFERAVRDAGFEQLVCLSNMLEIVYVLRDLGKEPDGLGMVFDLCRGTFADEAWFRRSTIIPQVRGNRVRSIDFSGDWWYVDDLAKRFMEKEGWLDLFRTHVGGRILAPDPDGDGRDVLKWLRGNPRA